MCVILKKKVSRHVLFVNIVFICFFLNKSIWKRRCVCVCVCGVEGGGLCSCARPRECCVGGVLRSLPFPMLDPRGACPPRRAAPVCPPGGSCVSV